MSNRETGAAAKQTKIPDALGSLERFIRLEAARRGVKLPRAGAAVLAGLDYGLETELKNSALHRFWKHFELPGRPDELVRSPMPRHYRTTSKRRCRLGTHASDVSGKNAAERIFAEGDEADLLEPAEHGLIFNSIGAGLALSQFAPLARSLHFIILRGTYTEFMVIFNFHSMDRVVNRLLLRLLDRLRGLPVNIISAFLFLDPARSAYYLDSAPLQKTFPIKRLFGPEYFRLRLCDTVFAVPPTSFSQVNESILPLLLKNVRDLLAGEYGKRLLDLYCGYGLFTFSLRRRYREIIAVDAASASIRAGVGMLTLAPGPARVTFKKLSISRNSLDAVLPAPPPAGDEDVVLDPPRRGVDAAVIASIARRRPGRVLHLFCAGDEIPAALRQWRRCGYLVRRIIPLDMFAGTPELETLILFSRP